jgi:hypothetical protein
VVEGLWVLLLVALFINVMVSMVAILSQRDAADPAEPRAERAHEPRSSGAAQGSSRQVTLVEAGDAVLARGF